MKEYIVTFGMKYEDRSHPTHPDIVDPDGYVTIVSINYDDARAAAFKLFGEHFAFMYDKPDSSGRDWPLFGHHFPVGETARFEAREVLAT